MMKHYEHTQFGYITMLALMTSIIFIAFLLANTGLDWTTFAVLIILGVALLLFSSLTVVIRDDVLEIRFGPGLIRKKFYLSDIESARVVRNHWYYGWGIRLTPHGWLFNVSGFAAVEIALRTGRKYRIGTDVPQELEQAIRQFLS